MIGRVVSSRHFLHCTAAVLAAAAIVFVVAPSGSTLALAAAFLICPLVMVIAMKLLMGGGHDLPGRSAPAEGADVPSESRRCT